MKPPTDTPKKERFTSSAIIGLVIANVIFWGCVIVLVILFCK